MEITTLFLVVGAVLYAILEWNHVDTIGTMTTGELSLIHISEPTRRTPISYAVFCLKKKSMPSSA